MEVDGANYLLPVDAELAASSELRSQAVKVGEILADLKSTGLPAKLLILDCCRNNPLPTRSWTRSRSSHTQKTAHPSPGPGERSSRDCWSSTRLLDVEPTFRNYYVGFLCVLAGEEAR